MIATLLDWDAALQAACAERGWDAGPVAWRLVDADRLYELAAVGMPGVMRHWTHGRDYWYERSRLSRGAGRLYEMVVHAEPPIAYLLDGNTVAAQKLVMAHVRGHAQIFRGHRLFRAHPTDYPQRLAAQERRRAAYAQTYGPDAVDWVLDRAYALSDQVADEGERAQPPRPARTDPYDDLFPRTAPPKRLRPPRYTLPTRDLLGFLARESPVLAVWERDLVACVRQEGLALAPNRAVKIIHEGWAAYVQQQLCTTLDVPAAEQIEMARVWAAVAAAPRDQINPYWFGWRFITWCLATHGPAATWAALCTETDASWIRNWLTPEAARALDLYQYTWQEETLPSGQAAWVARRTAQPRDPADWAAWREAWAAACVRAVPEIWVTGVDEATLVLTYQTPSQPLDDAWTVATLRAVRDLWGGPVRLEAGRTTYAVNREKEETS